MTPDTSRLEQLVDFALTQGGSDKCFGGWSRDVVKQYLEFHLLQNTLAFVSEEGGEICALGVAWRQDDDGKFEFNWQKNNDSGNTIFIHHVVASKPGAMLLLLARLARRWNDVLTTKVKGCRNGKLVDISNRYLDRLVRQEARHYGQC